MLIAVLADDPLGRETGHQDRHPALRQPGQPGQLIDRDTGVLADLPYGGQGQAVHGKRELSAGSQLHMLAAETPHHVPEQLSDLALRLLAA